MSLRRAITELEAEVDSFEQGTKNQPVVNSTRWFMLRAKSLGLSALKRMEQLEVGNEPAGAERYYREALKITKMVEVPPAPLVEREKLPK